MAAVTSAMVTLLLDQASRNGTTMRNGDSLVWELHLAY
jgi:hypothetical protein